MKLGTVLTLMLSVLPALLLFGSAIAADKYQPKPLQIDLLTERVAEHDDQISDLGERVDAIETKLSEALATKAESREIAVRVIVDDQRVTAKAGSGDPTKSQSVSTVAAVAAEAAPSAPAETRAVAGKPRTRILQTTSTSPAAARLKSTAELKSEIASRRTGRTYATISPATLSWAQRHLQDHGYTSNQVSGLSYSEAWQLHNLAHSPNKISPYTSGTRLASKRAEPVDVFVPTPRTPTNAPTPIPRYDSGCPGGRCPTSPSRSTGGGWFPGKLLFGR